MERRLEEMNRKIEEQAATIASLRLDLKEVTEMVRTLCESNSQTL
jgi:hypothetical protein